MYYIPQITNNDCLFTAFKILLANTKKDERYLYLPEEEKRGPYSLLEIIEKGKNYGVELLGFESDDKNGLRSFDKFPLILNLKRENQNLHSVYVYKVSKTTVYYLDSDIGKCKMQFDKFISIWDGTGLMIKNIDNSASKPDVLTIKPKSSFINKVLQVITAFCFILGIYFIDDKTNILVPIVCIGCGVIFEIVNKVVQMKRMKQFDFETIGLINKMKAKNYGEFIPRREKWKFNLFSSKNNYLYYLLCCVFIIFIVLMNNPYNIACVFVPIFLASVQSLVIAPYEKKREFQVECLEVKFSKEKNTASAVETLKKIEDESFKFSYSILFRRMVGILLFFISGFVTLLLLDGLNLINIFFLLFTEIYLYENLLPIFSYESRTMEEKLNYMRFLNLLQ